MQPLFEPEVKALVNNIIKDQDIPPLPYLSDSWEYNSKHMIPILSRYPSIKTILEIGSFTGAGSTRVFIEQLAMRNYKILCIDPLAPTVITQQLVDTFKLTVKPENYTKLYEHFLNNIRYLKAEEHVYLYRMTSTSFFNNINDFISRDTQLSVDVCYIDGNHSYQAVYDDIINCHKHFPQAQIWGDDWWQAEAIKEVRPAVIDAAKHLGLKPNGRDNCWTLDRA